MNYGRFFSKAQVRKLIYAAFPDRKLTNKEVTHLRARLNEAVQVLFRALLQSPKPKEQLNAERLSQDLKSLAHHVTQARKIIGSGHENAASVLGAAGIEDLPSYIKSFGFTAMAAVASSLGRAVLKGEVPQPPDYIAGVRRLRQIDRGLIDLLSAARHARRSKEPAIRPQPGWASSARSAPKQFGKAVLAALHEVLGFEIRLSRAHSAKGSGKPSGPLINFLKALFETLRERLGADAHLSKLAEAPFFNRGLEAMAKWIREFQKSDPGRGLVLRGQGRIF